MIDILTDQTSRQGRHDFGSLATSFYDPATRQQAGAVPRTGHDTANFFLGVANIYSASFQPGFMYFRGSEYAGYLQDNWKVYSRLILNLGVRYEYYPPVRETRNLLSSFDPKTKTVVMGATLDEMVAEKVTTPTLIKAFENIGVKFSRPSDVGLPEGLINANHLDFSPRIGFAYRLTSGKRATSLRGGYGLYRFQLALRTFAGAMRSSPPMQANFQVNLNAAAQTPDGLPNYLLRSVPTVFAGANSRDVLDPNTPPDVAPGNFTVAYFEPDQPTSRNHQWNLTLERELFDNTVARIGYVGTHGGKLDQWFQLNGAPTNYVWLSTTGQPVPTGRLAGTARRVFDQTTFGNINEYTKTGYSNFNSVQMEISRRFAKGYGFQFYYVLANNFRTLGANNTGPAEDFVNDPRTYLPGAVPENLDERIRMLTYIRDTEAPKHRVRWNWIVDLPFGKGKKLFGNAAGWKQRLIGGWQTGRQRRRAAATTSSCLPEIGAPIAPIEIYGKKYKIEDCRSGECVPGYLWYNGDRTAYRLSDQAVPSCFIRLDEVFDARFATFDEAYGHRGVIMAETICARMADLEMYAFLIEDARRRHTVDPTGDDKATILTRSFLVGYLGAGRALLDAVAGHARRALCPAPRQRRGAPLPTATSGTSSSPMRPTCTAATIRCASLSPSSCAGAWKRPTASRRWSSSQHHFGKFARATQRLQVLDDPEANLGHLMACHSAHGPLGRPPAPPRPLEAAVHDAVREDLPRSRKERRQRGRVLGPHSRAAWLASAGCASFRLRVPAPGRAGSCRSARSSVPGLCLPRCQLGVLPGLPTARTGWSPQSAAAPPCP